MADSDSEELLDIQCHCTCARWPRDAADVIEWGYDCWAVLVAEDVLTIVAVGAMVVFGFFDQQFVTAPLALLGLHVARLATLIVSYYFDGPWGWLLPVAVSVVIPVTCGQLQFKHMLDDFLPPYLLWVKESASALLVLFAVGCIWIPPCVRQKPRPYTPPPPAVRYACPVPVTAPPEIIIGEPHELLQAGDLDLEKQSMCVICLQYFQDEEELIKLTCGHLHHATCIRKWFENGKGGCTMRCSRGKVQKVRRLDGNQEWFC